MPLHLHRLCRAMRDRGFHCSVASLAPPGPVSRQIADDGFTVHHCEARGPLDLRALLRLARIVRLAQPDIIHSLLFHANIAARLVRALLRVPAERLLCEIQTVEIERHWHLFVDGLTQDLCRCVIGNSPSVIEHLAEQAHIQRHRLWLIPGGIDPDRVNAAPKLPRSAWSLPDDIPLLVWVGRLDPVKGLDDLLDAMTLVAARTQVHLVLAGEGEYREHLENRTRELRLEGHVTLLGRRDDVLSLLKVSDIFVFPSLTEGLPNALMEAMAAALPIVTTDVPGCRDLIQHERNGLHVPIRAPNALADAIVSLLQDPQAARRLGDAARESIVSRWNIQRTYDAYESLYRTVLDSFGFVW